jgi:hydroxylysine kinase
MTTNMIKPFNPDDLRFTPPSFQVDILRQFLLDQYGVTGAFKTLAGERDQNMSVTTEEGVKYIFKIASADELDESVDFQIKALLHLQQKDPGLSVPRQIRNKSGESYSVLNDENGLAHMARLLSYVDGCPVSEFDHLPFDAIREVGRITGRLCAGLNGFDHAAASHFMPWDSLNQIIFTEELRQKYTPDDFKPLAEVHLKRLQAYGMPKLLALPRQVIHNDGHSGNVMCAPDNPVNVTGIIDFGDLIAGPVIVDLAVSLNSMMDHNSDILASTSAMLEGYKKYVIIPDKQLELLYDALTVRSLLNVQLLYYRSIHHAHDEQKLLEEDFEGTLEKAKIFLGFSRDVFNDHVSSITAHRPSFND